MFLPDFGNYHQKPDPVLETVEILRTLWTLGIIITSIVTTWIIKRTMKSRMEKALKRKVEDRELVSIKAWMQAPPLDDESSRPEDER
jgi:hypothetical protein